MKGIGIDLGQKKPKSVHQFLNEEFDYVITLGRRALSCDWKFPRAEVVHWKFEDPAGRMIQKGNCVNFERSAIRSFSDCAYSFWFVFAPKFTLSGDDEDFGDSIKQLGPRPLPLVR